MVKPGFVVVGGSYAAMNAIAAARQHGYAEPITLVGDEDALPYERPPLSKSFLTGDAAPADLALKAERFYAEADVELRLGVRATRLDPAGRRLELADGRQLDFDQLLLATGARARALPVAGADLDGVQTLRSVGDALALRKRLPAVTDVVIIGAGFIGLELASCLRGAGRSVTVVEFLPRVLSRAVSADVSAELSRRHADQGVSIRFGAAVSSVEGRAGSVTGVRLADGSVLPADLVVIGVGAVPATELAVAAGLCPDPVAGIDVDAAMRTRAPHVLAAGDCALGSSRFAPVPVRLESVHNAVEQGRAAGATVAGVPAGASSAPRFWSDQAGASLQIAGLLGPGLTTVRRAEPGTEAFTLLHLAGDGRLVAAESVDRAGDHVQARNLISSGARLDPVAAADAAVPLKRTVLAEPAAVA